MHESRYHEMRFEQTHSSGADEWVCPTCGRRLLMYWPPAYRRVVLDAGDEQAIHSGGKGELQMRPPQVSAADEPPLSEEMRDALEEALKDADFGDEPQA
ncbi:MAG TPA: hypothetical protein VJ793_02685 [Anaerolineae bacterium]|nr:hypothetical protein [Anaerolineae bacterium]